MEPTAAPIDQIANLVWERYAKCGCTRLTRVVVVPRDDGSWTARPGPDLGHDDMIHFLAAVVQVQRLHFVLTD